MKRRSLGPVLLLPGAAWLVVFFLVPIGLVIALSVGSTDIVGRPLSEWNPGNYQDVFQAEYLRVVSRTLLYAGATLAICLVFGYTVAYTIGVYGGAYKNLLILLVVLPGIVDYLIRIFALQQLFLGDGLLASVLGPLGVVEKSQGLIGSPVAVIAGLAYNYIAFMVLPIYAVVERLDRQLVHAARDLGATPAAAFLRVTLPLSAPGVAAGCLFVFLASMGDFATAELLGDANTYLLGNLIQDQFLGTGGVTRPIGAGLAVVLMLMLGLALALYARFARGHGEDVVP